MNYRYLIGRAADQLMHHALSRRWLPLIRAVPIGVSWLYDLQRFAGRRNLTSFVDAGANVGQTSRQLLRYFPGASIHAFEPVQATFQQLVAALAGRAPAVRCRRQALGAQRGRTSIELRADSELNTLSPAPRAASAGPVRTEEIEIETLDDYAREQGLTYIDVLKLDVQGYELEVLRGARHLLRERRIAFIYSEVSFAGETGEVQDFVPLHGFLLAQGFNLAGFYEPFRWGPGKRHLGFCNALYLRPPPARPESQNPLASADASPPLTRSAR